MPFRATGGNFFHRRAPSRPLRPSTKPSDVLRRPKQPGLAPLSRSPAMKRFWAAPRKVHGRSSTHRSRHYRLAAHRAAESPVQPLEARRLLAADVVISELMHHAPTGDPGEEFVELYNRGDAPAYVGGWQFDQGVTYTLPAATIDAGQHFVVAAGLNKVLAKYPTVS